MSVVVSLKLKACCFEIDENICQDIEVFSNYLFKSLVGTLHPNFCSVLNPIREVSRIYLLTPSYKCIEFFHNVLVG